MNKRFELQLGLFEKGVEQVQNQILHLDDILFKIKASAITVWAALMGWAFSSTAYQVIPLGAVVIVGFWLLEGMFKGTQIKYISISSELMNFMNDSSRLDAVFESNTFDNNLIYPVALNLNEFSRGKLMLRGLTSPTVITIYLFLAFANLLIWMAYA